MDVKILKYHGVEVPFFKVSPDTWLVPARVLGHAIGYHAKGQKLVSSVKRWHKSGLLSPIVNLDMPHNGDLVLAEGGYLESLKAAVKGYAHPGLMPELGMATSMLLLGLQGVSKVITKANVAGVRELRDNWERVTTSLMDEKSPMPEFSAHPSEPKKQKGKTVVVEKETVSKKSDLEELEEFMLKARKMADLGNIPMPAAQAISQEAMKGYVSKKWPNAIVPAAQESGYVCQKLLPETIIHLTKLPFGQPLPEKFKGYLHATDMGKPWGFSSHKVGQHLKEILQRAYGEKEMRANFLAKTSIGRDVAKQEACRDPETGLSTFINYGANNGVSIALFVEDESGESHWTTFWRPDVAKWIMAELSKLPMTATLVPEPAPAPVPFSTNAEQKQ